MTKEFYMCVNSYLYSRETGNGQCLELLEIENNLK